MIRRRLFCGLLLSPAAALTRPLQGDSLLQRFNSYAKVHNEFIDRCKEFEDRISKEPVFPADLSREVSQLEKKAHKAFPLNDSGWPKS